MDLWSQMLTPLMSVRMPCSGDVWMNYNPWTNWGWSDFDAGNPDMEQDIFANVALPGKQLGKLQDAVRALIAAHPELGEGVSEQATAIREFEELARKISIRKEELQKTAKGQAESALRQLKQADREAFNELIDRKASERANEQ